MRERDSEDSGKTELQNRLALLQGEERIPMAPSQECHKLHVAFKKIVVSKLRWLNPDECLKNVVDELALESGDVEESQCHTAAGGVSVTGAVEFGTD